MNKYELEWWNEGKFDFAVVRFLGSVTDKLYLFKAPYMTLSEGEIVVCDTVLGDRPGVIEFVLSEKETDPSIRCIKKVLTATEPVKLIKSHADLREIDYSGIEEAEEASEKKTNEEGEQ